MVPARAEAGGRGGAAAAVRDARSLGVDRSASLAQADVRVELALRASRNLTVRRLSFSESAVEGMPVWIDEVEGDWRLRAGEEFLLPGTLRARVSALDVLQMEHLAQALRRRAVTVRTTVGDGGDALDGAPVLCRRHAHGAAPRRGRGAD